MHLYGSLTHPTHHCVHVSFALSLLFTLNQDPDTTAFSTFRHWHLEQKRGYSIMTFFLRLKYEYLQEKEKEHLWWI